MKRTGIYSVIFFFVFNVSARGETVFEFNDQVQRAYRQIIRLKLDEGKSLLDREQLVNPANVAPHLYYAYIDFLKAFISEDKKDFETFSNNFDKRLKYLKQDDSPFSLYAQAELMLQDAMLRVKFREFIFAAWEVRKAYKTIERNVDLHPGFLLNRKVTGFLHVLVGAVPQNYRWLVEMAGMKGTIPQGTAELRSLLKETNGTEYEVYQEEILFYLSGIYNVFSKMQSRPDELTGLIKPYCSKSLLMRYCYANLMTKSGRNDEALQALTESPEESDAYPFYFLSYKTGLAKLNKLDLTADADFQRFMINFKGINYLRSACQKLAWIALLQGKMEKYREYMALCSTTGSDFVDEDKEALNESITGNIPNIILLRARLLFDGGYYIESLSEMSGQAIEKFPRFKDQLEVTYRYARIHDKLGQTAKAITYYEQTLTNGSSSGYYFAANSALLLGTIYEEQNDVEKAKFYYRKCLSLRHHEYQNSIDQKARAGLERLNVKN